MKNTVLLSVFVAVLSSSVSAFAISKQCQFMKGEDAVVGKFIQVEITDKAFEIVKAERGYELVVTSYPGDVANGPKRSLFRYGGPDLGGNDGLRVELDRALLVPRAIGNVHIRLDNTSEGYVDTTYFCRD